MTDTPTTTPSAQAATQVPPGSPAWVDLSTSDIEGAKAFYGELFGWTFEDRGADVGHYHLVLLDGQPVGGLMSTEGMTCPQGGVVPTEWGLYLSGADAHAAAERVEAAGGSVLVAPMAVGAAGTMGVFVDSAGAAIGVWQAGDFAGVAVTGAPGTAVWFECLSQSIEAAIPFYRSVFGWDVHEMPGDWAYVTNGAGEAATAGLCDARGVVAPGTPSYWRIYLGTADLDRDLALVATLGGAVLDGPMDSPYGRLATVADPQGASFQLLQPPPA